MITTFHFFYFIVYFFFKTYLLLYFVWKYQNSSFRSVYQFPKKYLSFCLETVVNFLKVVVKGVWKGHYLKASFVKALKSFALGLSLAPSCLIARRRLIYTNHWLLLPRLSIPRIHSRYRVTVCIFNLSNFTLRFRKVASKINLPIRFSESERANGQWPLLSTSLLPPLLLPFDLFFCPFLDGICWYCWSVSTFLKPGQFYNPPFWVNHTMFTWHKVITCLLSKLA